MRAVDGRGKRGERGGCLQVFAKIGGGRKGGEEGEGEGRGVIEQEENPSSRSCFTLRVFSATVSASKMLENY